MDLGREVLPYALGAALAFVRCGAFMLTSPFPGPFVGTIQRVGLAILLAWVAASALPPASVPPTLDMQLMATAVGEMFIGLILGAVLRFLLAAAEVLAQTLSLASALSTPSTFNPAMQNPEAPLALAVNLLAILVMLASGVHRLVLAWLLESFRLLPIGATLHVQASAGMFVDLAAAATAVGTRLALPVVAVTLVAQVTLAFISRAAPSLQLFSVGFGVIVASGVSVLMASLRDIVAGLSQHLLLVSPRINELLLDVGAHGQ